nr:peptidylprolyl isomerase [uncultured Arsenicibacter sp.]
MKAHAFIVNLAFVAVVSFCTVSVAVAQGQPQPAVPLNKTVYTEKTAKQEIKQLYKRLRAGESFEGLAQQYSQDVGSREHGGDLGWAKPRVYVPPVDKVLAKLKPGQYSKPFKTVFGYHIFQLVDRRENESWSKHIVLSLKRDTKTAQL